MNEAIFGGYRLERLLGEGPTARVFRAVEVGSQRIVAVKILSREISSNEAFARRFHRNLESAAGIRTPNVVPIHGFGDVDGTLYVATGLMNRNLAATRFASQDEAMAALRQIAGALDSAHRIGLVHGGVAPTNILFGTSTGTAYLSDLGSSGTAALGVGLGAPTRYTAPETVATGTCDPGSDIYALACVMRDYLADPFGAPVQATGQRPRQGLDSVLARGLDPDPTRRYPTASALTDAGAAALGVTAREPVTESARETNKPARETNTGHAAFGKPADDGVPGHDDGAPVFVGAPASTAAPTVPTSWLRRHLVAVTAVAALVVTAASVTALLAYAATRPTTDRLVSDRQVNAIMGVEEMAVIDQLDAPVPDFVPITPLECDAFDAFASTSQYEGSGLKSIRVSIMREPGNDPTNWALQSVATMESPQRADEFLDEQAQVWRACNGKPYGFGGAAVSMTSFEAADHELVATTGSVDGKQTCQRVLRAQGAKILAATACGKSIDDEAKSIVARQSELAR